MLKHNIEAHQISMNPWKLIEAILLNYSSTIRTCNGTVTIINPMKESKYTTAAVTHKLTPINICPILPSYLPPTNKLLMNFSTLTLSPSSTKILSTSTDYLPFIFHLLLYLTFKKTSNVTKAKQTTNINIEKYINFDFHHASIRLLNLSIRLWFLSNRFLFFFFLETLALKLIVQKVADLLHLFLFKIDFGLDGFALKILIQQQVLHLITSQLNLGNCLHKALQLPHIQPAIIPNNLVNDALQIRINHEEFLV